MSQEIIALTIVAVTAVGVAVRFYRDVVAEFLAQRLLKGGQVKWAMGIRRHVRSAKSGCSSCKV